MFLAEKTVKNLTRSALFAKLGMERRTQAAAYAARVFNHDHGSGDGGSHRGFSGPGDGTRCSGAITQIQYKVADCCTVHGPSGFAVTPMMRT